MVAHRWQMGCATDPATVAATVACPGAPLVVHWWHQWQKAGGPPVGHQTYATTLGISGKKLVALRWATGGIPPICTNWPSSGLGTASFPVRNDTI